MSQNQYRAWCSQHQQHPKDCWEQHTGQKVTNLDHTIDQYRTVKYTWKQSYTKVPYTESMDEVLDDMTRLW